MSTNMPPLTQHPERRALALCMILGAGLCGVGLGSFARASAEYVPITEVVLFRSLITLPFLGAYLVLTGRPLMCRGKLLLIVRSLTGFISLCLGFYAITKLPFVGQAILAKTSVVFTALLGMVLLKERVSVRFVCCVLVAFIGAALVLKPDGRMWNIGGLAVVASGLTVALTAISTRKLHETDHATTIVFGFALWSCIFSVLFFGREVVTPPAAAVLPLLSMGLCGMVGQLLFTWAFKHAAASFVQSCSFADVLMSLIVSTVVWKESATFWDLLGGALIIAAGIGLVWEKRVERELAEEV